MHELIDEQPDPAGNDFTRLVGCELPIQLAPLAGAIATPRLPLAVAQAGGHAVYPAVMLSSERLAAVLDELEAATTAFGVNFVVPLLDRDCLDLAAGRAPLVDFFYGEPDSELVSVVHAGGALASWQVGSRREALAAAAAGCDVVVAQGVEAGGRVRGDQPLTQLLDEVLNVVDVPVLAAGGVGSALSVAAVLAAGAAGVRVGTRFIASEESEAHRRWKQALAAASAADSVITRSFSVRVPDFPHRVLRSSLDAAAAHSDEYVAEIDRDGRRVQLPVFSPEPPSRDAAGAIEAMPFYAGRSVAAVKKVAPAGDILAELASGAMAAFESSGGRVSPATPMGGVR